MKIHYLSESYFNDVKSSKQHQKKSSSDVMTSISKTATIIKNNSIIDELLSDEKLTKRFIQRLHILLQDSTFVQSDIALKRTEYPGDDFFKKFKLDHVYYKNLGRYLPGEEYKISQYVQLWLDHINLDKNSATGELYINLYYNSGNFTTDLSTYKYTGNCLLLGFLKYCCHPNFNAYTPDREKFISTLDKKYTPYKDRYLNLYNLLPVETYSFRERRFFDIKLTSTSEMTWLNDRFIELYIYMQNNGCNFQDLYDDFKYKNTDKFITDLFFTETYKKDLTKDLKLFKEDLKKYPETAWIVSELEIPVKFNIYFSKYDFNDSPSSSAVLAMNNI